MKAAIYARYSSDNQREESIEAQIQSATTYANEHDIDIIKIYYDEAKSATTDKRPQFLEMISDAPKDLFDVIIIYKLDRFSRDRYDFAYYKRLLRKYDIRVISVLENLDGSPESIILESVLEGMAEYYSKNLAREVMQKGMLPNAQKCLHNGGVAPLGYDVGMDKHYTVNQYEAQAIKIIYDMYASGVGYSKIIDVLAEKGYKTKSGNKFSKNSLYGILTNEKYKGMYVFNKTKRKHNDNGKSNVKKSDAEIIKIENGMPAIIDDDLWNDVKIRMLNNKNRQASYNSKRVYILSGKIFCGKCKAAFLGNTTTSGRKKELYSYYECGNKKRNRNCDMKSISANYIENEVINILYNNIFNPEIIDLFVDKVFLYVEKQKNEVPDYIKESKKQLIKLDIELSRIVVAITKGMYYDTMKEKMEELEDNKSALKARISEAEYENNTYSVTRQQIKRYVLSFENIKTMTNDEQKKAISIFVDKIYINENDFDVEIINPFDNKICGDLR